MRAAAAAATTGFTSAAGQASQFASDNYRCVIVLLALMARSGNKRDGGRGWGGGGRGRG